MPGSWMDFHRLKTLVCGHRSCFYTSLNTVIIGFVLGNEAVGFYAAAEKLFIAMRSAFYPIVYALYPYMSARERVGMFKKLLYLVLAGAVLLGSGCGSEFCTGSCFGGFGCIGFDSGIGSGSDSISRTSNVTV